MPGSDQEWDPRLSVHALSSRRWTLWEDLELYDRLRIRRISVALPKLADAGIEEGVNEIVGRELRVDGIYAGSAFDLADEPSWAAVQDTMATAVDVGARLGAHTLQTTGGSAGGQTFELAAERLGRALEPVTSAARRAGLRVALEPTRPQFAHVGMVHTLRDALVLAERLDLWLAPDTAHLWWEPGLFDLLRAGASRFAVVQVADLGFDGPVLERLVPGDGRLALGPFFEAVASGGFDGPFELELIGQAIEDEGYEPALRRSLSRVGALLATPGDGGPA
jgi:sugar phosphate isomerase/epimerase